jgi:hypothetical protein
MLPLVRRTVEGLDRKLKVKIKDEKVIANIPSSLHCDQKAPPVELDFTPPCSPLFAWQSISDCTRGEFADVWSSFGCQMSFGSALSPKITPPWAPADSLVWAGGLTPLANLDPLNFAPLPADAIAAGSA